MEDKTSEIDRLELGRKLVKLFDDYEVRKYWKPIYEGTAFITCFFIIAGILRHWQ